jgi:hypothetical protein
MPNKYFNPTLASQIAGASSPRFLDAQKVVKETFNRAINIVDKTIMPAFKDKQKDYEALTSVAYDENDLATFLATPSKEYLKKIKNDAFEKMKGAGSAERKKIIAEAKQSVNGVDVVNKVSTGLLKASTEAIGDKNISTLNSEEDIARLASIEKMKINYASENGKFFEIPDENGKMQSYTIEEAQKLLNVLYKPVDSHNKSNSVINKYRLEKIPGKADTFTPRDKAALQAGFDSILNDPKEGYTFALDVLANEQEIGGVSREKLFIEKYNGLTKGELEEEVIKEYNQENPEKKLDIQNYHHQEIIRSIIKDKASDALVKATRIPYDEVKITEPVEKATESEKKEQAVRRDVLRAAKMLKTKDFNSTISKIGSLSKTGNIQSPESYKARINELSSELKDLGVEAKVQYKKDEEGEDTNILEGFIIYPTRTLLNTKGTEQIINTSQTPNQIKKAILNALGRSYGTLDLPYDQLINTENSLPKF